MKKIKIVLSAVVALLLMISAVLPVCAKIIDWKIERDYISDGTNKYELFELPEQYVVNDARDRDFLTQNTKIGFYLHDDSVIATAGMTGIYTVDGYVYADAANRKELQSFIDGNFTYAHFEGSNSYEYADIEPDFVTLLDSAYSSASTQKNVQELQHASRRYIVTLDKTLTVAHCHGAVLVDGDQWYYINYDVLGNQYFDANGNFSYRKGEVTVLLLDGNLKKTVEKLNDNMEYHSFESNYLYMEEAENEKEEKPDNQAAKVGFWVAVIFLGVLVPAVPFVFGIVLSKKSRVSCRKWWLLLSAAALLWMICVGAILLILFL